MKILVCMSHVPDTTTKVKFSGDFKTLDTTGIQWVINPWDELSLTRALELKDDASKGIEKVTVANVGTAVTEPTIRKALAIGADDAMRVDAEPADAYFVAAQLAEVIKNDPYDIILCGIESSDYNGSMVGGMLAEFLGYPSVIESSDYNGSMVGGMLAEFLGYPSVSAVSSLGIENGQAFVTREIDGGKELLAMPLPFVAIVQKGVAKEPRIAAMRGIMMARSKPIRVVPPAAVEAVSGIVSYEKPKPRAACKFVDAENPKQLIELLQNEAKVI